LIADTGFVHNILGWLGLSGLIIASAIVAFGISLRFTRPKRWCPGPRHPGRWWPTRLVWMRRCGYDLSSTPTGVCPECGHAVRPTRNLRWAGPVQLTGTAVLLATVSLSAAGARRAIRTGWYVIRTPTTVLVLLERPGETVDFRLQSELTRRFERGEVTGWSLRRLVRAAADELEAPGSAWGPDADDYYDQRRARMILSHAWPESRPMLESLLASRQWDNRAFATDVLWNRIEGEPSDALLAATVDQLRDDRHLGNSYQLGFNARQSVRRLVLHLDRALPLLEASLDAEDDQQRYLAAAIIAGERAGPRQARAAEILVERLGLNDTRSDAIVAAGVLALAGPEADAALIAGSESNDPQRSAWSRAILDRRAGVPWEQIEPRLESHRLTTRTREPFAPDTVSAVSMLGY